MTSMQSLALVPSRSGSGRVLVRSGGNQVSMKRHGPSIARKSKRSSRPQDYTFTKNKNMSKNSLVKLKGKITRHIKRTFPRNIGSLFLKDIQPTWVHFLEEYGKGDHDLSDVERPQCSNDYGFMAPPEAVNESKRTAETKKYINKRRWDCTDHFYSLCHPVLDEFNITGISVSLLDRTRQVVKFSINYPLMVISRNVSIDGHAILSKDSLVVLDASRDWRMLYNPLVHGPPFIRFYAAVPLKSKNDIVIGALAVFDPYIRCACPSGLVESLRELAISIVEFVDQAASSISPRVFSLNTYGSKISNAFGIDSKVINRRMPDTSIKALPDTHHQLGLDGLRKLNCNPSILHSFEISQELMESHNALAAVERAAQILAEALGLNIAYIIEIRTSQAFIIPSAKAEFFQNGDVFDLENKNFLGECIGENINIRLLGGIGLPKEDLKFDRQVHMQVLNSAYGMHFDSSDSKSPYPSGIFMPFRKSLAKLYFRPTDQEIVLNSSGNNTSPKFPALCSVGKCRKRRLWDQLSLFSLSTRRDNQEFTQLYKTAPVGAITAPFGESNVASLSAPGIFCPFETVDSDVDMASEEELSQEMAKMGIKTPVPLEDDNHEVLQKINNEQITKDVINLIPKVKPNFQEQHDFREEKIGQYVEIDSIRDKKTLELKDLGVKVKIKYGGYIMAGVSHDHRSFSPSDVEYMKLCVKALESLFACK